MVETPQVIWKAVIISDKILLKKNYCLTVIESSMIVLTTFSLHTLHTPVDLVWAAVVKCQNFLNILSLNSHSSGYMFLMPHMYVNFVYQIQGLFPLICGFI